MRKTKGILTILTTFLLICPIDSVGASGEESPQTQEGTGQSDETSGQPSSQTSPPEDVVIGEDQLSITIPSMDSLPEEIARELGNVVAQDPPECVTCRKQLMDARWSLRQKCLSGGGDDASCDGNDVGKTCCHCRESPEANPECWELCDYDCLWSEQCAGPCGWEEPVEGATPDSGADKTSNAEIE